MKSCAAVLVKCGAPLEMMDLEIPTLQEGQVLVQVKYSGICRSQLNEIKGLKGPDHYLPHTLGHEGSGIVVDLGPGVTKVKKDQPVILTWIKGEGIDAKGTVYTSGDLKVNSGPISTFLEYAVIAENRLIPIGSEIPLKEASLFGCAIPTGAGIVHNELDIKPNSTVAIFGLGGIGLSSLLAASAKGAKQIIAIDLEPAKLKLAQELGATDTLLFNGDTLNNIQTLTEGKGVDFAVEAVGKKGVMELAFQSVKDQTGLCVLAGNVPKDTKIECDPFNFIKGKRLIGTWGGRVKPDRDIPYFLKSFFPGNHPLAKLISHESTLDDINTLVDLLDQGKTARTLVRF
ncbi:zinc-binding dehydrogenase [Candidatus Neptunochlamydia vexilliferae]|uniref:S-(Hydroxymethyl)glutathione dehydrogenase n=1 Tax=Candidatus Neptunichlamydia vexilliferae TaxID=1651774 RepID=A0ABS0B0I5_9BACT|nr:zinc-binding dehydrogenase [Candidatus Neptunochlamydia vexilliferae]MBF5059903.1 S-(hydroxymethyl)glutathione dehydrogenase [Candidatus Neptunochlamydia vexilliferae]